MSTKRMSAAALALVISAGATAAVSARTSVADTLSDAQGQPRAVEQNARAIGAGEALPGRVYAAPPIHPQPAGAEDSTATVTLRTIVDPNGSVADVRVESVAFEGNKGMFFSQARDGVLALDGLERARAMRAARGMPEGPAQMNEEVLRPALEAFIDAASAAVKQWQFESPQGAPVAFNVTVQFVKNGEVRSTTTPILSRGQASLGVRAGGNFKPPTKVKHVAPVYPPEALDAGVQGVVIMELRVEGDGRVGDARVLRSVPMLDEAALDAVRQWEFVPTLLNGAPVPVMTTVTVQFTRQEP